MPNIGNGRGGGIAPAYAITSYKAEGQTYDAALGLAAPGAVNREGMYVTLSRGRADLQLYSIDPNNSRERLEAEIAGLPDQRTITQALRDALQRSDRPDVASIADPGIAAALATLGSPGRGQDLNEAIVAAQAVARPAAPIVELLGPRPPRPGAHQDLWDQAVSSQAIYALRDPESFEPGSIIPTRATPDQPELLDIRTVNDTLERARIAAIAAEPLDRLLAERNQLTAINPERQLRQLSQTATESVRAVESATRLHDIAAVGLTPWGPLRRVPQAEIDRVASLASDIEQASDAGQVAERALSSAAPELHEQTRRQLDITDALSWRVDQAVDRPARYLTDVLGPRPEGADRPAWNKAAEAIEWTRHNHGLTPSHGPLPGPTPLARAVGIDLTNSRPLTRAVEYSLDPSLRRSFRLER